MSNSSKAKIIDKANGHYDEEALPGVNSINQTHEPLLSDKAVKGISSLIAYQVSKLQPKATRSGCCKRFFTWDEAFTLGFLLASYFFVGYYSTYPFLAAGARGSQYYPAFNSEIATEIFTFGYNVLVNGFFTYSNLKTLRHTLNYRRQALSKSDNWKRFGFAFVLSALSSVPFAGLAVDSGLSFLPYVLAAYLGYTFLHYSGATALIDGLSNIFNWDNCSCCQSSCYQCKNKTLYYDNVVDELKALVTNNVEHVKQPLKKNWDAFEMIHDPVSFIMDQMPNIDQAQYQQERTSLQKFMYGLFLTALFLAAGWAGPLSYLFSSKDAVDNLVENEAPEVVDWGLTALAFLAFVPLVGDVLCFEMGAKFYNAAAQVWNQPNWRDSGMKFLQKLIGDEDNEQCFNCKRTFRVALYTLSFLPSYYSAGSAFFLFNGSSLSSINKNKVLVSMTIANAMLFNGYPAPIVTGAFIDSIEYYFRCKDTPDKQTANQACNEFSAQVQLMDSEEFLGFLKDYPEVLVNKKDELKQLNSKAHKQQLYGDQDEGCFIEGWDDDLNDDSDEQWINTVIDSAKKLPPKPSWGQTLSRLFCPSRKRGINTNSLDNVESSMLELSSQGHHTGQDELDAEQQPSTTAYMSMS